MFGVSATAEWINLSPHGHMQQAEAHNTHYNVYQITIITTWGISHSYIPYHNYGTWSTKNSSLYLTYTFTSIIQWLTYLHFHLVTDNKSRSYVCHFYNSYQTYLSLTINYTWSLLSLLIIRKFHDLYIHIYQSCTLYHSHSYPLILFIITYLYTLILI